MTRTKQLHDRLIAIKNAHANELKNLQYRGPKGGSNARTIKGWIRSTNNITRAGGLPMLNWWDGSNPTPSTGIPECCAAEAFAAEEEIFGS